jgi:hypothetical protein
MRWAPGDITFSGFDAAATEGDVVTIRVKTPAGEIRVMAEIDLVGRTLIMNGTHMESHGGPLSIGVANLRALAAAGMDGLR